MLESINIENFAVVKKLSVDLKGGLNIITGETGAGKSVIIEAISMALGSRADTSYVRTGCDKAVVTLCIDTDDCCIGETLGSFGIPDDNPMVIRREISSQSKSVCRINGTIVPLSALNAVCGKIADIHGQYDQQLLLDPENHLNILDLYGGSKTAGRKETVRTLYAEYSECASELSALKKNVADAERQRDFLSFELKEIEDAAVKPGEDDELEESIKLMENSELLYKALASSYSLVFSSDSSADSALGNAVKELESVGGISKNIDDIAARLRDAYYELDDLNSELRHLRDSITYSQSELDQSIERLNVVNKIKRKYGGSIEAALEYAEKARNSLQSIENSDDRQRVLSENLKALKEQFFNASAELSKERKAAASRLKKEIDKELSELNFKDAVFGVSFEDGGMSETGTDSIEFLISANKGEDLKPLAKVASGGELSRIMLALKRITGDTDGIPTMIFDEIDTGISGATAAVVGEKLLSIADKHQVICITHLPQIACKGESHYKIEKSSDGISTSTTVVPLGKDERAEEIARLLSGSTVTDAARLQAKELLGY